MAWLVVKPSQIFVCYSSFCKIRVFDLPIQIVIEPIFSTKSSAPSMESIIDDGLKGVVSKETGMVDISLSKTLLEGKDNSLFYAIFNTENHGKLKWSFNPYAEEQIEFSKRRTLSIVEEGFYEVINQYSSDNEVPIENFEKGDFSIDKYTIDCSIGKSLQFSAVTSIKGAVSVENAQWLNFYLSKYMSISSVQMNGNQIPFYQEKTGGSCWVDLTKSYKKGDTLELQFTYSSDNIMIRLYDWTFLENSIGWYPHSGYRKYAYFDATFHVPKRYVFIAVGDNISMSENDDDIVTTKWVTPTRIRNYSFNIGVFSSKKFIDKELPDFTIHSLHTEQRENVMQDIGLSFKFYQKIYGDLGLKHFDATEISAFHGEAFPGLLHLSHVTFLDGENSGGQEVFCGHEVAHQWWGIGVDFQSYHDQWLSEAFSEYSALMYMQSVLSNEKFFKMIRKYREKIIERQKTLLGKGSKCSPISLGRRTYSSFSPEDYDLIVYKKGAWVLHMIRNMMLDLQTMKEDGFFKVMKTFFETYKGKEATTRDFRNVIEQYVGNDVGWFFDQWVDGSDIPSYKFAYKVIEKEGKYLVKCRIYQENVPPEFRMSVPIKVDFGDKKSIRVRALITGKKAEFDLPLMPLKPKEVVFNDLESVLCDVENIDWIE